MSERSLLGVQIVKIQVLGVRKIGKNSGHLWQENTDRDKGDGGVMGILETENHFIKRKVVKIKLSV